jgi:hypothetical protein
MLASGLALGLCAAIMAAARTSSAYRGSGGTSSGGAASSAAGGSTYVAWRTGGAAGVAGASSAHSGGNAAGSSQTTGIVAPPAGIDAGPTRPTWREAEIVLTVDPSFMAMPYAKQALEGALLAWTSVADQLPKVTLRYAEDSISGQSSATNLGDHRIFYVPQGDSRAKGALAITLVTADEGKGSILDADILVNGGHLFTDVAAAQSRSGTFYDLENVLTHEFGHWFGLDEDYMNTEATMYAYVYPGETKKRDLAQSDITAVQLAYWQADNPSENSGCSLTRTPPAGIPWMLGCLAVAGGLLRRRNRLSAPHLPARSCRLHP